jgi:hypothetical protein
MTIVLNGTTGITNDGGYTGDGVVFADTTPANTLVTTTGGNVGVGIASPSQKLHIAKNGTLGIRLDNQATNYWDIENNSNLLFSRGGTEYARIDSSGRMTTPYQPAFFAGLSATFAHPSGVVKISGTFTATVNIGSGFNTSTQRFTAPVSGTYYLSACVGTNSGGGTFSYLSSEIWVNGSRRIIGGWDGGGTAYGKTSTSGIAYLNASDYVELYCEANKAFTVEGNSSSTFLSGHLVG